MGKILQTAILLPVCLAMTIGAQGSVCSALSVFGHDPHHHADSGSSFACLEDHEHVENESPADRTPCDESCASDLTEATLSENSRPPANSFPADVPAVDFTAIEPLPAVSRPALAPSPEPPDRLPLLQSRRFTGRFLV